MKEYGELADTHRRQFVAATPISVSLVESFYSQLNVDSFAVFVVLIVP